MFRTRPSSFPFTHTLSQMSGASSTPSTVVNSEAPSRTSLPGDAGKEQEHKTTNEFKPDLRFWVRCYPDTHLMRGMLTGRADRFSVDVSHLLPRCSRGHRCRHGAPRHGRGPLRKPLALSDA